MELLLDISREQSTDFGDDFVRAVVEAAIAGGSQYSSAIARASIDVAFVGEDAIRALNREYRGKDAVTDVLSFGDFADEGLPAVLSEELFLGQVMVCYDEVVRAAAEDAVSLTREMAYILSHGVLHLLGHDHTDAMFAIQDTISLQY